MRTATLLEAERLYEIMGIRPGRSPGVDVETLREAIAESQMVETLREAELAHELGAPERVFRAGADAIRGYVARASVLAMLGIAYNPEHVTTQVANDFRRRDLMEQTSGAGDEAVRAAEMTSLENQINAIERTIGELVNFRSFDKKSLDTVKSEITGLLNEKAGLIADLAKMRAKAQENKVGITDPKQEATARPAAGAASLREGLSSSPEDGLYASPDEMRADPRRHFRHIE